MIKLRHWSRQNTKSCYCLQLNVEFICFVPFSSDSGTMRTSNGLVNWWNRHISTYSDAHDFKDHFQRLNSLDFGSHQVELANYLVDRSSIIRKVFGFQFIAENDNIRYAALVNSKRGDKLPRVRDNASEQTIFGLVQYGTFAVKNSVLAKL